VDKGKYIPVTINLTIMDMQAFHKARVEREMIEGREILVSTFLRECVNQTVQRVLYGESLR